MGDHRRVARDAVEVPSLAGGEVMPEMLTQGFSSGLRSSGVP